MAVGIEFFRRARFAARADAGDFRLECGAILGHDLFQCGAHLASGFRLEHLPDHLGLISLDNCAVVRDQGFYNTRLQQAASVGDRTIRAGYLQRRDAQRISITGARKIHRIAGMADKAGRFPAEKYPGLATETPAPDIIIEPLHAQLACDLIGPDIARFLEHPFHREHAVRRIVRHPDRPLPDITRCDRIWMSAA